MSNESYQSSLGHVVEFADPTYGGEVSWLSFDIVAHGATSPVPVTTEELTTLGINGAGEFLIADVNTSAKQASELRPCNLLQSMIAARAEDFKPVVHPPEQNS